MSCNTRITVSIISRCCRVVLVALILMGLARTAAADVCDQIQGCLVVHYVRACGGATAAQCNDNNDGRTPRTAWASLLRAADYLKKSANGGDVIIVGPGVYVEGDVSLETSGIRSRPIQFRADPTGAATGDAPGPVLIDVHQRYDTGFTVYGASNVVIQGFQITNARVAGVQIRLGETGGKSTGAVVANNVIFNNGDVVGRGVDVTDADSTLVFNNLIYNNATTGIGIRGTPKAQVINNTVYGNGGDGIVVGDDDAGTRASTGVLVVNNIIGGVGASGAAIGVDNDSICNYIGAFNLLAVSPDIAYRPGTPHDPSDMVGGAPGFVNPQQGNFALTAGSVAIDAGSVDASVLGLDQSSATVDLVPDSGVVDLGYHAGQPTYPLLNTAPLPTTRLVYVRAGGSDSADGATPETALATIGAAIVANSAATTRVVVGPGTYPESLSLQRCKLSGPIELVGDESGQLTGDPAGPVIVDAQHANDTPFLVFGATKVTIQGFHITNGRVAGVQIRPGPTGDRPQGIVVANNVIYANGERIGRGVDITDTDTMLVFNNLIYNNTTTGIGVLGTPKVRIVNNTLYGNGGDGIVIAQSDGSMRASTGGWVINNLIASVPQTSVAIDVDDASKCDYVGAFNLLDTSTIARYSATSPRDPSDIVGLPAGLTAPGAGDFTLATGSPAIDAGSVQASVLGLDQASATPDGMPDHDTVDIGYHKGQLTYPVLHSLPLTTQTLYVRTAGSDAADGSSPDQAFATINAAVERARARARIIVGPGTYTENVHVKDKKPAGPLTLLADPTGQLTDDSAGAVVVDANRDGDAITVVEHCSTTIDGFSVTNAADGGNSGDGIYITAAHGSIIRNNIAFSNNAVGINVADSNDVQIFDNLVYANGSVPFQYGGGIQIGGAAGSKHALIQNNTAYANGVLGIFVGAGSGSSTGATQRYNIRQANGFGDPSGDALFVDPAGADGVLGGTGFADDDFHLSQLAAGQSQQSPAVDAGEATAQAAGLATRTTRTDGAPDDGAVDLGFHYPRLPASTIFVSLDGSDTNTGVDPSQPLRTITAALRHADTGMRVEIGAGRYAESGLHPAHGVTVAGAGPSQTIVDAGGDSTVFDIRQDGVTIEHLSLVGASSAAVRVRSDAATVFDCWVYSNQDKGILLTSGSGAVLFNNLIFANANTGIVMAGDGTSVQHVTVANNTLYSNANRGITLGLGSTAISADVVVVNNVMAGNSRSGFESNPGAVSGLTVDYNCNGDGVKGVSDTLDTTMDPLLVNPRGPDGALGGTGVADDDFSLSQTAAGQAQTSPCVDSGWGTAEDLGLAESSTRTDDVWDAGWVDAGYHYGVGDADPLQIADVVRSRDLRGDCDGNGAPSISDLVMAIRVALGLNSTDDCVSADRDGNGIVTIDEIVIAIQTALTA